MHVEREYSPDCYCEECKLMQPIYCVELHYGSVRLCLDCMDKLAKLLAWKAVDLK